VDARAALLGVLLRPRSSLARLAATPPDRRGLGVVLVAALLHSGLCLGLAAAGLGPSRPPLGLSGPPAYVAIGLLLPPVAVLQWRGASWVLARLGRSGAQAPGARGALAWALSVPGLGLVLADAVLLALGGPALLTRAALPVLAGVGVWRWGLAGLVARATGGPGGPPPMLVGLVAVLTHTVLGAWILR
jgi:hypothetical protein